MRAPLARVAAPLAAVATALLFGAAPQSVAEPITVTVNTGSGDLIVRSAPSPSSQKIGSIPDASRVVITCSIRGENFSGGPYKLTTDLWNRLATGGFVTDAMLDTGSDEPVVPPCVAETPSPPTSNVPSASR